MPKRMRYLARGLFGETPQMVTYRAGRLPTQESEGGSGYVNMQVAAPPEGAGNEPVIGRNYTVHWGTPTGPLVNRAVQFGQFQSGGRTWEHVPLPFSGGGVTWDQPMMSPSQYVSQEMAGPGGITPAGVRALRGPLMEQNMAMGNAPIPGMEAPTEDLSEPPPPGSSMAQIIDWQRRMRAAYGPGGGRRTSGAYVRGGNIWNAADYTGGE